MSRPSRLRAALSRRRRTKDPNAAVIDVRDVDLAFRNDVGVFDLSFAVRPGTIFGLIGPSGSGKTTTVRLLTGLYKPDRGSVTVLGRASNRFRAGIRERIGYMPQQFVLYPNLTVRENLNFVASLYGLGYFKRRKPLQSLLEFVELEESQHQLSNKLSGGMQRRLLLACALVHNPTLLFADEPTAGIDPVLRGKFWRYFRDLRNQGRTLFVTTQYVGEAAYCDLVGVMRAGRLIHIDTPDGLRRKALGGEVIRLMVEAPNAMDAARVVYNHPDVRDVRRARRQPGLLYLYVEDAGIVMPKIVSAFEDYPHITLQQIEEYQPPFDDIFVALMEQAEKEAEQAHV